METLLQYNLIILIFSVITFLSNLGSLIYITKTFDTVESRFSKRKFSKLSRFSKLY